MTKVLLIRHCRSTANAAGVLAGRAPGVALDPAGQEQAQRLREELSALRVVAAYTSPVQRCRDTARLAGFADAEVVEGLTECDYGRWTGARLADLARDPLWGRVQAHPGAVRFPGGESMLEMRDRVVAAILGVVARHSAGETVAVFSHGDPIKAALADALGLDFDRFQRIDVAPGSASLVDFGDPARPVVQAINAAVDLSRFLVAGHRPTLGGGDTAGPEAT
ncbi:MAG TPA: MSMEG_4193 family putative phosphomutase [Arachnia sp.]|nr:MSMEG_4193 family putative phosphomutase [Arachnia sp.]HMT85061.1 MSMEG_4193 family putative phosphomutase [Arachnia sp.]